MKALIDKNFIPMYVVLNDFKRECAGDNGKPFGIAVERENGCVHRYDMRISRTDAERSYDVVERVVKTLLWIAGGYRIYLAGDDELARRLKADYTKDGARAFDVDFMSRVYEREFEVIVCNYTELPKENGAKKHIGGHVNGCRIGLDLGGSTKKVCAAIDGEVVFTEQLSWQPKQNSDPLYHVREITAAIKSAADKLPRVDGIGVSGAGIYVNDRVMIASLFLKVADGDFDKHVKNMFKVVADSYAVPVTVANDGDVTALAGAHELGDVKVLGLSLGTSTGGGYVTADGGLNGFINELGFVPVAFNRDCVDEWSGDYGTGANYICQEGVIHLGELIGHKFEGTTPAQRFGELYRAVENDPDRYGDVFRNMGEYLGYAVAYYSEFYDLKRVLLMGGVTGGTGGGIMIDAAREVLKELDLNITLELPSAIDPRVGLSIVAATLPEID